MSVTGGFQGSSERRSSASTRTSSSSSTRIDFREYRDVMPKVAPREEESPGSSVRDQPDDGHPRATAPQLASIAERGSIRTADGAGPRPPEVPRLRHPRLEPPPLPGAKRRPSATLEAFREAIRCARRPRRAPTAGRSRRWAFTGSARRWEEERRGSGRTSDDPRRDPPHPTRRPSTARLHPSRGRPAAASGSPECFARSGGAHLRRRPSHEHLYRPPKSSRVRGRRHPRRRLRESVPSDDLIPSPRCDPRSVQVAQATAIAARSPASIIGRSLAKQLGEDPASATACRSHLRRSGSPSAPRRLAPADHAKQFPRHRHARGRLRPVRTQARLHRTCTASAEQILRGRAATASTCVEIGRRSTTSSTPARSRVWINPPPGRTASTATMDGEELNHGLFTCAPQHQADRNGRRCVSFMVVVAAFTVVATLLIMVVLDKKKEIASPQGDRRGGVRILRVFLYQGKRHHRARSGRRSGLIIGWTLRVQGARRVWVSLGPEGLFHLEAAGEPPADRVPHHGHRRHPDLPRSRRSFRPLYAARMRPSDRPARTE